MSMSQKDNVKYNGWANYATWNINLWVMNDEMAYRAMLAARPFTAKSAKRFVKEQFPGGTPDTKRYGGLSSVNWGEIADSWNVE